jgi:hypothetical protein
LKDDGLSYSYRNITLAAIKHDYIMQDHLVLNWRKIAKFLGENERRYEIRGYTHDEIKRMLDIADVKYKAIILLLASTGMRRDALVKIELKDMEYLKDHNLYKIKIYKKSKYEQICFTTPEAADAIKLFLKASMRNGAKYFHNVGDKAISMALGNLAARAGIIEKGGLGFGAEHRNQVPAVHGLRKFCITQMAKAKVDTEIAKLLTGHSIGVRGRYLNYSEDDLLQEYLKALDLLTINETNRLRKKVDILEEKEDEIKTLKELLESYESQINQLTDSQKEIRDFMDRHNQELEHTRKVLFMLEAHAEGKTMRYNEVQTRKETLNNPEFKEWCKMYEKRLKKQSNQKTNPN